jgi:hypothetical protein
MQGGGCPSSFCGAAGTNPGTPRFQRTIVDQWEELIALGSGRAWLRVIMGRSERYGFGGSPSNKCAFRRDYTLEAMRTQVARKTFTHTPRRLITSRSHGGFT